MKTRSGYGRALSRTVPGAVAALLLAGLAACGGGEPSGGGSAGGSASGSTSAGASGHAGPSGPARSPRPDETPAPGDQQLSMVWDGKERTYELHAPPSYQLGKAMPLVVVMHFSGGDAATMRKMTNFDAKADREGFLVAYPNGVGGNFNALICCGGNDDVGFVKAMVEHTAKVWGTDPKRTYATGISNGAELAYRMAVEVPGMFAAIAPVSGSFTGSKANADPSFKPSQPVPVVTFLGNDDKNLRQLWVGLGVWQKKLGCTPGAQTWFDPGKTVEQVTAACADGSQVVSYVVHGMGHSWPGGVAVGLGDPRMKINAVDVMWAFFAAVKSQS